MLAGQRRVVVVLAVQPEPVPVPVPVPVLVLVLVAQPAQCARRHSSINSGGKKAFDPEVHWLRCDR